MSLTGSADLEVQRVGRGERWITLIGYVLDPLNPKAGNLDIIDGLLAQLDTCEGFPETTERLGGRWILIVNDGIRSIMFTDAVGMRQAFYTRGEPTWCASQPGLLAEVLNVQIDEGARAFTQTDRYANDKDASTCSTTLLAPRATCGRRERSLTASFRLS
jgi:hypothetical protein